MQGWAAPRAPYCFTELFFRLLLWRRVSTRKKDTNVITTLQVFHLENGRNNAQPPSLELLVIRVIEKDIVTIYNNDILSRKALVDTEVGQSTPPRPPPVPVAIIPILCASYFESSLWVSFFHLSCFLSGLSHPAPTLANFRLEWYMEHNYGDFCLHSRFLDQQTLTCFTSSSGANTCSTFHYQDGAALPGMGLCLWLQGSLRYKSHL